MGCRSGEIELGMPYLPQISMEMEMRKLFPEDFQSHSPFGNLTPLHLQESHQPSRPSSSSTLSADSPDHTSFLSNFNPMKEASLMINQPKPTSPDLITSRYTQAAFPTTESVDAAITNAIITTLSCPSSSYLRASTDRSKRQRGQFSAFNKYDGALQFTSSHRSQSMIKKALGFYRELNLMRLQEHNAALQLEGLSCPTSTQLRHIISERKRREMISERLQALRSLLPPSTKKDKLTVLRTAKEYISSLKGQVSQLKKRNQQLEAFLPLKSNIENSTTMSSNERFLVRITPTSQSTSGEKCMDLCVSVRGDGSSVPDLVLLLLGFLEGVDEVSLTSLEVQTRVPYSREQPQEEGEEQARPYHHSINQVTMRLIIQVSDWDQSAFQEAVKTIIADFSDTMTR